MKNKNINWINRKKRTAPRPPLNRRKLKHALLLTVILVIVSTFMGLLPSFYVTLDDGKYIALGENSEGNVEWIAAGSEENYLSGRYFKIDRYSSTSGLPASEFEVMPAGFPISCGFAEPVLRGKFGFYAFNLFFFVNWVFWFMLSMGIVYYFYPVAKKKVDGKKKKQRKR